MIVPIAPRLRNLALTHWKPPQSSVLGILSYHVLLVDGQTEAQRGLKTGPCRPETPIQSTCPPPEPALLHRSTHLASHTTCFCLSSPAAIHRVMFCPLTINLRRAGLGLAYSLLYPHSTMLPQSGSPQRCYFKCDQLCIQLTLVTGWPWSVIFPFAMIVHTGIQIQ